MHCLQAESDLIKAVLAEVFRQQAFPLHNNFWHVTILHELNEDPETILKFVYTLTFDELVAVEVGDQTALVNDILPFSFVPRANKLQGELLLVRFAFNFKDLALASSADLAGNSIHLGRILFYNDLGLVWHIWKIERWLSKRLWLADDRADGHFGVLFSEALLILGLKRRFEMWWETVHEKVTVLHAPRYLYINIFSGIRLVDDYNEVITLLIHSDVIGNRL